MDLFKINKATDAALLEASLPDEATYFEPFVIDGFEYLHQITPLQNESYSLLLKPNLFGQFRLQLTDLRDDDPYAPDGHGGIVRELCTYDVNTARLVMSVLSQIDEPEERCSLLAHTLNCEHPRGRIRLDTPWVHEGEHCPQCNKHMRDFERYGCSACDRRSRDRVERQS